MKRSARVLFNGFSAAAFFATFVYDVVQPLQTERTALFRAQVLELDDEENIVREESHAGV